MGILMGIQKAMNGLYIYTKEKMTKMVGTVKALNETYLANAGLKFSVKLFFGLLICRHIKKLKTPNKQIFAV